MNLKKYVLNGLVLGLIAMPFAAAGGMGTGQAAAAEKLAAAPAVQTNLAGNTATAAVKKEAALLENDLDKSDKLQVDMIVSNPPYKRK